MSYPFLPPLGKFPGYTPPNTQIKFFDPFTGREGPTVNPFDRVTTIFNSNGINVQITGSSNDVKRAEALLRLNQKVSEQPLDFVSDEVVYPITADIKTYKRDPGTSVVRQSMSGSGWSYIPNPKNTSKVLLTHPSLTKPFSGSGVIFFEKSYQTGNGSPTVILVKTKRGLYEDMGGELDKMIPASEDTLKTNANKEVREESQGLFIINRMDLERKINGISLKHDISDTVNNAYYRCYYVALSGTGMYQLDQLFKSNKNLLRTSFPFLGSEMDETININRFYLPSIKSTLATSPAGGIVCNDVNGNACTIRDRTAECLRMILNSSSLTSVVFDNPVTTMFEQDRNMLSSMGGIVKLNIN